MKIVIELDPRTKKNHQRVYVHSRTGKPFVVPSEQYKLFEFSAGAYIKSPEEPIDYPVNVKCVYYMQTKRRVDLVNLQEATLDILVKYGVLKDDNSGIVASMDGSRVYHDRKRPRTEIEICPAERI